MEMFLPLVLVLGVIVLAAAIVWRQRHPEGVVVSPWILATVLGVVMTLLVVSVIRGNGWNVATFSVLTVSWLVLLIDSVRRRASRP